MINAMCSGICLNTLYLKRCPNNISTHMFSNATTNNCACFTWFCNMRFGVPPRRPLGALLSFSSALGAPSALGAILRASPNNFFIHNYIICFNIFKLWTFQLCLFGINTSWDVDISNMWTCLNHILHAQVLIFLICLLFQCWCFLSSKLDYCYIFSTLVTAYVHRLCLHVAYACFKNVCALLQHDDTCSILLYLCMYFYKLLGAFWVGVQNFKTKLKSYYL